MQTTCFAPWTDLKQKTTSHVAFWADQHHKVRLISMLFCKDDCPIDGWADRILSRYCGHLVDCGLANQEIRYELTSDVGNTGEELIHRDTAEFERWCSRADL